MRKNQKGFSPVELILLFVIVGLIGGVGWWVWRQRGANPPAADNAPQNAAPAAAAEEAAAGHCTATADYTVYTNNDIGFCFVYPTVWGNVTLNEGVIDATQEDGLGYVGTYSANADASFALQRDDWEYTGPGRDGPNHAVGFQIYEPFVTYDAATTVVKVNNADKQLTATNTILNFDGVNINAKRRFTDTPQYAGIDYQLNVASNAGFDALSDSPDTLVTAAQFTQMNTILDSVVEF